MNSHKSLWQEARPADQVWSFYCPQCKIPRKIPYKARPTLKHYAQVGLTALVFVLLTWNWFTWKGIVAFVPMWVVFEALYRTKVRAALSCENCGFDPILYLVDVKRARRDIEDHWKKRFEEKGIPYPSSQSSKEKKPSLTKNPPVDQPPVQ